MKLRWPLRTSLTALCVIFGIAVASCDETTPAAPSTVSREEFAAAGKVWPLSVAEGEVGCVPNKTHRDGDALWFRSPDKTIYGLNSFASVERGFADLKPIWLEDEQANAEIEAAFPGQKLAEPLRLSIGDLAERAQGVCYAAPLS